MGNTAGIINTANEKMDISGVTTMLREFEKAGMKMEMKMDVMNDAMDNGEANEEADDIYESILGEMNM